MLKFNCILPLVKQAILILLYQPSGAVRITTGCTARWLDHRVGYELRVMLF